MMATPPPGPLLSVRAALVLLVAVVVGLVAGVLGYFANGGIANAVLIGGAVAGSALALFHTLVDRESGTKWGRQRSPLAED